MKWSQYNHIMRSAKYGTFIFNSVTNSFLRISEDLLAKIETVQNWEDELKDFGNDFVKILLEHKIVVTDGFDNDVFNQKKYLKYLSSFNSSVAGLTIATTTGCNFCCPYCYESSAKGENMSESVENAIVRYIELLQKPIDITWYGGEPLLNWKTIENLTYRIAAIKPKKEVAYTLITNGYLLSRDKCDFFSKTGMQHIQITLDGIEDTHNKSRISKNGKPSYQTIMDNIDYALSVLPNTYIAIRVNIGSHNKEDYPMLRDEVYNRWGKYRKNVGIHFAFIVDYNSCHSGCLTSKQQIDYIKELYSKHKILSRNIFPENRTGVCCANKRDSFVVAPDGTLYKCWVDMGKREKQVGTIFEPEKITNLSLLSRYAVEDKFSDVHCMKCFLLPLCGGLCPAIKEVALPDGTCPYDFQYIDSILEMAYEVMQSAKCKDSDLVRFGKIVERKV